MKMKINKKICGHPSNLRHLRAKKILLILLMTVLVSCGQQQLKSQHIQSIAYVLAEQVPEINEKYDHTFSSHDNGAEKIDQTHYLYRFTNHDNEYDRRKLQMYWYERPNAPTDWVMVSYVDGAIPGFQPWLKCFDFAPTTGALKETEIPFVIPPPREFDKDEFEGVNEYWRSEYNILNDGSIVISASPSMNATCVTLAHWRQKDGFTIYRRGINSSYGAHIDDDANAEQYVRNVIRPNFQRINAIEKWEWIDEKIVWDTSLEGANITCYYSKDGLEKIVVSCSGETCNATYEYYFFNRYLSFVYSIKRENSGQVKERRWYIKAGFCFRGIGDNGKKLSLDDEDVAFDLNNETERIFELGINN